MHFVFSPAPAPPLTIEEMVLDAAEPGPLRLTRVVGVEVHILFVCGVVCGLVCECVMVWAGKMLELCWVCSERET